MSGNTAPSTAATQQQQAPTTPTPTTPTPTPPTPTLSLRGVEGVQTISPLGALSSATRCAAPAPAPAARPPACPLARLPACVAPTDCSMRVRVNADSARAKEKGRQHGGRQGERSAGAVALRRPAVSAVRRGARQRSSVRAASMHALPLALVVRWPRGTIFSLLFPLPPHTSASCAPQRQLAGHACTRLLALWRCCGVGIADEVRCGVAPAVAPCVVQGEMGLGGAECARCVLIVEAWMWSLWGGVRVCVCDGSLHVVCWCVPWLL